MRDEPFVPALGALSGGQAVQSVKAGLKAIYCSGWQVAADANTAGQVYPDQSLYPADAVPTLVKRLNRALTRADQIEHAEGGEMKERESFFFSFSSARRSFLPRRFRRVFFFRSPPPPPPKKKLFQVRPATGTPRSSPTPRPASAAPSTASR